MSNQLKIGKLEAAKRQLETAVILYFNEKDPISIHTLAAAAHHIIVDLNKKAGGQPLILEGAIVKEEYKDEFRKMIREAKNFLKHADIDQDKVLDFNLVSNDYYLLDACEGYEMLTGEKNPYFTIYRGWFHYMHPNILSNPVSAQIIKNQFGGNKIEYFTSMLSAAGVLR